MTEQHVMDVEKAPPVPARLLVWALGWAVVAAIGLWVMIGLPADFAPKNSNSWGVVYVLPVATALMALLLVVRAAVLAPKHRAYAAAFSPEQRAAARLDFEASYPVPLFLIVGVAGGVVFLTGVTLVLVNAERLGENPTGLGIAIELLALITLAWLPALVSAFRASRARRLLARR